MTCPHSGHSTQGISRPGVEDGQKSRPHLRDHANAFHIDCGPVRAALNAQSQKAIFWPSETALFENQPWLEVDSSAELENSREVALAADDTERSVIECVAWNTELNMVGKVEGLCSELEVKTLGEREHLG